jgi:hypothetical protein
MPPDSKITVNNFKDILLPAVRHGKKVPIFCSGGDKKLPHQIKQQACGTLSIGGLFEDLIGLIRDILTSTRSSL